MSDKNTDKNNPISSSKPQIPTGCAMVPELWKVAIECNIEYPGIVGTGGRVASFVKCGNLADFFNVATQKCWEERTREMGTHVPYPPVIQTKIKHLPSGSAGGSSSGSSGGSSGGSSAGPK